MVENDHRTIAVTAAISVLSALGCSRPAQPDPGHVPVPSDSTAASSNAELTNAPPRPQEDVVTLRMPLSSTSSHYGAGFVADKYGFYKARGLKIAYVNLAPGSGPAIEALRKGDIDIFSGGTGHPDGFIDALLAGLRVKAVVAITKGHPNFAHATAWVPADSAIKKPGDVVGKRVGGLSTEGWTQGCAAFYWSQYFKQHHITPDQVTNAVVPPLQQEQALRQGSIDVMTSSPPLTALLERNGQYRQLWSSWDVTSGDVIDKQDAEISVTGFTEDFIQKKPDVVQRYVKATIQASAFTVDNQEVYVDWLNKRAGWSAPIHDRGAHQNWSTGLIRPRALQKWIDWKVESGQVKPGQVQPSDLYTNKFNPYSVYAMNDPVKNPTYWDNLPKEFLYLPIRK